MDMTGRLALTRRRARCAPAVQRIAADSLRRRPRSNVIKSLDQHDIHQDTAAGTICLRSQIDRN
jgi:hypothetical protein